MKKIILSLSKAVLAISLQAQQEEMEATKSAFKAKNYSEAVQQAHKAEELLKSNYTIEPKDLAEFYLNAANSAKAAGDMTTAAEFYAKLGKLESMTILRAKNKDTKNWEYFFSQKEAESVTSAGNYGGLKEFAFDGNAMQELAPQLNNEANKTLDAANKAFTAQNYELAGKEFLKSYHLYSAVGNKNDLLKYYAGIAMLQTDEKEKAAHLMQELVDSGFTGVQQNFYAKEKDTGKKVAFASKQDMDTQVKLGLATDPEVETTESLEEELLSNTTYAWYSLEEWDKALAVGKKGLSKFPENENMNQLVTGVYYKSGNSAEFVKTLRTKVNNGTATGVDLFNLAKSIEDDSGDLEEAKKFYKMSIEKDPKFANSYLNLAFAIIKGEEKFVELMNQNLGTSAKEKKIYNENRAKRKGLYEEALPYLEKAYQIEPENLNLIKVLRNTYEVVGNDDKYFEFKKKFEAKARN